MTDGLPDAGGRETSRPPVSFGMMVVLCTFPDLEKARELATEIITGELAACVNLIPQVESIYRWEGETKNDPEVLAVFKVSADGFGKLEEAILEKHPYEVPEIVGIDTDKVEGRYLDWVVSKQGVAISQSPMPTGS